MGMDNGKAGLRQMWLTPSFFVFEKIPQFYLLIIILIYIIIIIITSAVGHSLLGTGLPHRPSVALLGPAADGRWEGETIYIYCFTFLVDILLISYA